MNYTKSQGYFDSSNKFTKIAWYAYKPKGQVKGLVQLSHGMCEYAERYESFGFIDYLTEHGYAVIASDHLGHGRSINTEEDRGFFAVDGGWIFLVKDLRKAAVIGRKMFGDVPYYLIGHSMGSLIARCYLTKFSEDTDGAVLLGTVGRTPALPGAIAMAEKEIVLHGVKSRPKSLNKIFFGAMERGISDKRTCYDWLSRDEKAVDAFAADPKCDFVFTAAGFKDLFMLLSYSTSADWYKKVRRDLPILLMSGGDDPVGGCGKGVMDFFIGLYRHSFTDIEIKLPAGSRHELLNEPEREEYFSDIVHWLDVRTKRGSRENGSR